jgi:hypothetical protein
LKDGFEKVRKLLESRAYEWECRALLMSQFRDKAEASNQELKKELDEAREENARLQAELSKKSS